MAPIEMTFYQRFEADILAGEKTITIRDSSERYFRPGSVVKVYTLESSRWFCDVKIESVEPIYFDQLSDIHAQQENMTLDQLQQVIKEIYPDTNELYVISFSLVS